MPPCWTLLQPAFRKRASYTRRRPAISIGRRIRSLKAGPCSFCWPITGISPAPGPAPRRVPLSFGRFLVGKRSRRDPAPHGRRRELPHRGCRRSSQPVPRRIYAGAENGPRCHDGGLNPVGVYACKDQRLDRSLAGWPGCAGSHAGKTAVVLSPEYAVARRAL